MKVKRQKRARRIMTFFHFNYQYNEPYKVLLDGTFCQAALQTKINLREQMPKYMDAPVELFTTNCVMEELKRLGKEVHGALRICEQFDVAKCPHTPVRTAAACVEHMGRRSRKPVHEKFVIASQDEQLLFNLRDFGGIPLMSIKFNAILLEKPSKASENLEEQKSAELKAVEQLKQQLLGDEEATGKKKKKKKVKGPNPLSCKKKKRLNEPSSRAAGMLKLQAPEAAAVMPLSFFATNLNAHCSSMLLAQDPSNARIFLIVGKINGETVFFPIARDQCISKFESEAVEPVTALTAGDLRNVGRREVVAITSNGLLQTLNFPKNETPDDPPIPSLVFCQQINANICAAEIVELEHQNLLCVVMTDRVGGADVSLPNAEEKCLHSLYKFEAPEQISGDIHFFLSQACQDHYLKLDLGINKEVHVMNSHSTDRKHATLLFVPSNPLCVCLMQSLVQKIVIVHESGETVLENEGGGDFVCCTHTRLLSGIHVLLAIDPFGGLTIYAFNSQSVLKEPIARCEVLKDVDHAVAFPAAHKYSFFLALVNIHKRVLLYQINLSSVVQVEKIRK
ncbi:hypothetical protein M3Y99_00040400 [Aphelenchoides fujianensis]|nr:hypothetical protein M3Y99_00040400 [Aphelenchoides fujianensis]